MTVDHTGNIATQGKDSTAIFAQSVGGGGGNAEAEDSAVSDHLTAPDAALDVFSDPKSSVNVTIGRKGGTGGIGGDVSVASNGILSTLGDKSVGILAQSVGNAGRRQRHDVGCGQLRERSGSAARPRRRHGRSRGKCRRHDEWLHRHDWRGRARDSRRAERGRWWWGRWRGNERTASG